MPRRKISQREAHENAKELQQLREAISSWNAIARSSDGFAHSKRLQGPPILTIDLSDRAIGLLQGIRVAEPLAVFTANLSGVKLVVHAMHSQETRGER